jgi:hypothetical protein
MTIDLKFAALVFGIVFLMVLLTRKAIRKVKKEQAEKEITGKFQQPVQPQKPILTEEQYQKSWKSLGYLLLLAAVGNLYMTYTALRTIVEQENVWFFWVDAASSFAAAIAAIIIWRLRRKLAVFVYAFFAIIPILMFMSLKGPGFKENALIHLFPLVLIYFVLQPVWNRMED